MPTTDTTATASEPRADAVDHRLSQRTAVGRKLDQSIHHQRASFFFRHLRPWLEPGESVVDVGAGDGLIAAMMRDQCHCAVRAFDIEARSLEGFPVEVYDGTHLPLADGEIDAAVCIAVLHHCEEPDAVLAEIRRVVRRRFLLIEDRFNSRLDRWGVIGFHHYLKLVESMPFDRHGFHSTTDWTARLEKAGFRVSRTMDLGRTLWWIPIVNTLHVCEAV